MDEGSPCSMADKMWVTSVIGWPSLLENTASLIISPMPAAR